MAELTDPTAVLLSIFNERLSRVEAALRAWHESYHIDIDAGFVSSPGRRHFIAALERSGFGPAPCSAPAPDAEKPENHPDFCKYCGTVPCKHEREPQPSPAPAAGQKAEVARSMQDTLEKISVCGRCDTCRSMAVAVLALADDLERRERGEGTHG